MNILGLILVLCCLIILIMLIVKSFKDVDYAEFILPWILFSVLITSFAFCISSKEGYVINANERYINYDDNLSYFSKKTTSQVLS